MADDATVTDTVVGDENASGAEPAPAAAETPQSTDTTPPSGDATPPSGAQPPASPADWREQLSEDIRGSKALQDVSDVDSLARQLIDAQAYVGNSIRIPSEHASDEDRQAFHDKLRQVLPNLREVDPADLPLETADAYQVPSTDVELNAGMVDWSRNMAHEVGLSQAQYNKLLNHYLVYEQQLDEASRQEREQGYTELRNEWGFAYDEKVNQALRVAQLTGAPMDVQQAIQNQQMRPEHLAWLSNIADQFGDSAVVEQNLGRTEITPREAQAQLDEIMNNREHPYWSRSPGPEKDRAIQEVMALRHKAMGKSGAKVAVNLSGLGPEDEPDEDSSVHGGTLFAGTVS